MIGAQKALNWIVSHIDYHRRSLMWGGFFYKRNSVDVTKLGAGLPRYVEYTGQNMPSPIPVNGLPADVENERQMWEQQAQFISSIRKGENIPTSNVSGLAVQSIIDLQNEQLEAVFVNCVMPTWGKVMNGYLKLIKKNYTDKRKAMLFTDKDTFEIFEFDGNDISDETSVRTEMQAGFGSLKATKMEMLKVMMSQGILQNLNDAELEGVFEAFDAGDILKRNNRIDHNRAELENDKLKNLSERPELRPVDNHQIHYIVHSNCMKQPAFDDFTDEQKFILNEHTMRHYEAMNAQQMQAEQRMGAQQGAVVQQQPAQQ
jgi:hypothetical protein